LAGARGQKGCGMLLLDKEFRGNEVAKMSIESYFNKDLTNEEW
jgi:hypothetical protein